jgi:tryptophan synthase alpha chain
MTSIAEVFNELRKKNEGALIAYLTVGDPNIESTPRLVGALIEGGADIIELGIPFSDPIADGPTIQNAVSRSLLAGAEPLDAMRAARVILEGHPDTPIVLMTYFNPIFRLGPSRFLQLARASGVSGIIVPDLPVEESREYKKQCTDSGIDTIFLSSPSTEPERLKQILLQTSGYLYLISLYGVTGIRVKTSDSALGLITKYRDHLAGCVPLAVGFGISQPEHVGKIIQAGADGVIVGSAFVKIVEKNTRNLSQTAQKLKNLARAMKMATRSARS